VQPVTQYAKSGDVHVAYQGLRFSDRGRHILKGIPDEWQLFAVSVS
jgi:hypothetical protein